MNLRRITSGSAVLVFCLAASHLTAQTLSVPRSGDNQHAIVTQYIGPVAITIDYHSPDVTSPTGENRTGKIWGDLVPWGMVNLGFGTCTECPWRAGANENTTFSTTHDVEIEGARLPAGKYGLFMVADPSEWTLIFSKDADSWGSYFYDPADDALRVRVRPRNGEFHEWLTYEFIDRQPDEATAALMWENLVVPFTIRVPRISEVYMAGLRKEMSNAEGFEWQNRVAAADYALRNNYLDDALFWAETASVDSFIGQENFTTLSMLARVQAAMGKSAEAQKTMDRAIAHRTASPSDLNAWGRRLIADGKAGEAMKVFRTAHERFRGAWPTELGLARGYSATGDFARALEHAKKALAQAPDERNRQAVQAMIDKLGRREDINP